MDTLISDLQKNIKLNSSSPQQINLILDSGAFSGSYLIGVLKYIKALELQNKVKVNKISGCSVGALLGYFYLTDKLGMCEDVIEKVKNSYCSTGLFETTKVRKFFETKCDKDDYKKCNNRLFCTYFDVRDLKNKESCKYQTLVYEFTDNAHLFECLVRGSYIPFFSDNTLFYDKYYIDGFYPYVFKEEPETKCIFCLLIQNYLSGMFYIKDEINFSERETKGILETHAYFSGRPSYLLYDFESYQLNANLQIRHAICYLLLYLLIIFEWCVNYFKNSKIASVCYEIFLINKQILITHFCT
jgi:hypothetical protein